MSFSCNTDRFPSLDSYAAARKHFDSVKPYRGCPASDPRPIGTRSHKNKLMRELADGSIAFRLFRTDCVIWHPDNTLTVEGYPSVSTTAFVNTLVPSGVSHGQGRSGGSPILTLSTPGERYWLNTDNDYDTWVHNPDYGKDTKIIQCSRPVRLHYTAGRWEPVDLDELRPFRVPTTNRKAARAVSKQYNLPTLQQVVQATLALAGLPEPTRRANMSDVMERLECADYMGAIALMPRSDGPRSQWHTGPFGMTIPPKGALEAGFLRRLRDHIYEHEGVIEITEKRALSPSGYQKFVADANRLDIY